MCTYFMSDKKIILMSIYIYSNLREDLYNIIALNTSDYDLHINAKRPLWLGGFIIRYRYYTLAKISDRELKRFGNHTCSHHHQ